MENGVTINLEELTHLAVYRAALAELVVKAGGEITVTIDIESKPLFISYSAIDGDMPSETCIKITANRVENIH